MEERRRLTRDREHRMIGGVCAGIAKHFDWDPTLVRVAFVLLSLVSGIGIIAYLVMWLILPAGEPTGAPARAVMRENADEIAERARLAAASAQAAAEAARQAADQLAEAARAAGRAARDTWQQGSQQTAGSASASKGAAAEGMDVGSETGAPAATATLVPEETPPSEAPGAETAWPPNRELPSTDASPEPPTGGSGEGESSGPPRM